MFKRPLYHWPRKTPSTNFHPCDKEACQLIVVIVVIVILRRVRFRLDVADLKGTQKEHCEPT